MARGLRLHSSTSSSATARWCIVDLVGNSRYCAGCRSGTDIARAKGSWWANRLQEFSGAEVTTIRGPQRRRVIHGPVRWYPIPLQLRYKARSKQGPVQGVGQTRMMSSRGIIFAAGDGLKPGMNVEIVVDWPHLLEGRIRLQLVLEVTITDNRDGVAHGRVALYDFRTAGLAEEKKERK